MRLAAVRRLAYEAADSGLVSPDLAAGTRRVKGAKKLGICRAGTIWGDGMTERIVWHVVKAYAGKLNLDELAPTTFVGRAHACVMRRAER